MQQWFIFTTGLIVAVSLGYLIYLLVAYLRRKKPIVLSAHDLLVQEIITIDNHIGIGNSQYCYVLLTDALKKFMMNKYHYSIMDKTDDEIVLLLTSCDMPTDLRHYIQNIFAQASTYKFSHNEIISTDYMKEQLAQLRALIEQLNVVESLANDASN